MSEQDDKQLVSQQHGAQDLPDWAIEPVGKPEEFGLAKDSRPSKKRVWDCQKDFLVVRKSR